MVIESEDRGKREEEEEGGEGRGQEGGEITAAFLLIQSQNAESKSSAHGQHVIYDPYHFP